MSESSYVYLRYDADDAWDPKANCKGVDPDVFYPENGYSVTAAKAICRECVVQAECLEYALGVNEHHGIWGGMTERERKQISRSFYLQTRAIQRIKNHTTDI